MTPRKSSVQGPMRCTESAFCRCATLSTARRGVYIALAKVPRCAAHLLRRATDSISCPRCTDRACRIIGSPLAVKARPGSAAFAFRASSITRIGALKAPALSSFRNFSPRFLLGELTNFVNLFHRGFPDLAEPSGARFFIEFRISFTGSSTSRCVSLRYVAISRTEWRPSASSTSSAPEHHRAGWQCDDRLLTPK